ncbi:MAG: V-type ATP synthase subunit E family protein [Methanomicrobiaceae archaeon]|nr:V-type ATP synthase subunit E family protein [Methanomicrobiaceae archaeon]
MALDAVVGEIREKAKQEAEAIRRAGKAESDAILAEAKQQADEIKIAADEDANRQTEYILRQEHAAANLAVKREILNAQKEKLDEVYSAALEQVAALPDVFHKKAVRELCKRAAAELAGGVIYCNERDKPAVEDALSSLKTLSGFTFAGTVDILGGIIAESRDGGMQLDYSYSTFLAEVWESGLKDASEILFQ